MNLISRILCLTVFLSTLLCALPQARAEQDPDFAGISHWFNTDKPLAMQDLRGKVVLVEFWTYSCVNCIRVLPYVTAWDRAYRDKGLVVVGVHSPEFKFEYKPANVQAAIDRYHIEYPVALDNKSATWNNFRNQYWPARYLIDRDGKIVYTHFGEGAYAETESRIQELLGLAANGETKNPPPSSDPGQTPETYVGYGRAEHFASLEPVLRNDRRTYSLPETLALHSWGLNGPWLVEAERATAAAATSTLKLHFRSRKVYAVMGSFSGMPIAVSLSVNGASLPPVTVGEHKLYELVGNDAPQDGVLEIAPVSSGLQIYAFTFGR